MVSVTVSDEMESVEIVANTDSEGEKWQNTCIPASLCKYSHYVELEAEIQAPHARHAKQ